MFKSFTKTTANQAFFPRLVREFPKLPVRVALHLLVPEVTDYRVSGSCIIGLDNKGQQVCLIALPQTFVEAA